MNRSRPDLPVTVAAAALYLVLALAATWPLPATLASDVPGDLGDPLLNLWILDWVARGLAGLVTGDTTLDGIAAANIFHPEPVTLGLSEHLAAQALVAAPVLATSGNVLLAYNVVFIASYVLSGLGTFLLVHELTGSRLAALVAGVVFAFAPLRAAQLSHIQVLSTQWLPLALLGWRRYVLTGRGWPLAGATAATVMLGWSSGYALLFATPLLALFVVHQAWSLRRWQSARLWIGAALAVLGLAVAFWPVAALYLQVRAAHALERPRSEVVAFSADLGGYLTAPETVRLWGSRLRVAPKPEGELFLGFTAMALALVGVGAAVVAARHASRNGAAPLSTSRDIVGQNSKAPGQILRTLSLNVGNGAAPFWRLQRAAGWAGAALSLLHLSLLAIVVVAGPLRLSLLGVSVRATDPGRLVALTAVFATVWLLLSRHGRATAQRFSRSWEACAVIAVVLAVWLSLGPNPVSGGRELEGLGLYGVLLDYVPGYSGLRVPARFAFVALTFLALLAGAGTATLCGRVRRPGLLACALGTLVFIEGWAAPIPVNATWSQATTSPPPRVFPSAQAPSVYQALAALPSPVIVAEFPFGDPEWELRYVYYATVHRHRLVNGYSGGFPAGYQFRVARFRRVTEEPDAAWGTLRAAGTTHVVLHRGGMGTDAEMVSRWLLSNGADLLATYDQTDALYRLR